MKLKKHLSLLLVLVLLMGAFAGCSSSEPAGEEPTGEAPAPAPEKQFVTIVTGSTGGTYYPVGTILATLWSEKLGDQGVVAAAQSSGGSIENLNMLKSNEAQLGIAVASLGYFAMTGEENFADNKFEDVRLVTGLWPELSQIVVTEASGINSISDVAGHSINVGGAGSGTEYGTLKILEILGGLTPDQYRAEHLGYSEASSAMQNGQLDAMNAEAGIPTSSVSEIFASKTKVKMLSFTDEEYAKLKAEAPQYGQFTVPAGLYPGLDEDIVTVGIKSALFTNASADEELIYNLTKTMYEYHVEIVGSHQALESVTLENAVVGLPPVPLHPGAVKYYQEKGIEIPAEMMP